MMGTPLWEEESDSTCNTTMIGIILALLLQYPFL